jgi:hypothetical protein
MNPLIEFPILLTMGNAGGTSTSGAAQVNDATNSFKRLLTGSGSGQMNLGAVSKAQAPESRIASSEHAYSNLIMNDIRQSDEISDNMLY